MGCVNSEGQFAHWFGNIHLSGPCNRSCYFCIGQHMMALDPLNNLDVFPLLSLDEFLQRCAEKGIREVNVTGSNTDPLLYEHTSALKTALLEQIPNLLLGIRTNGAMILQKPYIWGLYDKGSISITSLDPAIYRATMGQGRPPDLARIIALRPEMPLKINMVLCEETVSTGDIESTLVALHRLGIRKVNLREPYGQPHIGDPLGKPDAMRLGMPVHYFGAMDVTYWDVHYVEVESVNLYANGVVSTTYPVTRGHDPVEGKVVPQEKWATSGRKQEQWLQPVQY